MITAIAAVILENGERLQWKTDITYQELTLEVKDGIEKKDVRVYNNIESRSEAKGLGTLCEEQVIIDYSNVKGALVWKVDNISIAKPGLVLQ